MKELNIVTLLQLVQIAVFFIGGVAGFQKLLDAVKALDVKIDNTAKTANDGIERAERRLDRLEEGRFRA